VDSISEELKRLGLTTKVEKLEQTLTKHRDTILSTLAVRCEGIEIELATIGTEMLAFQDRADDFLKDLFEHSQGTTAGVTRLLNRTRYLPVHVRSLLNMSSTASTWRETVGKRFTKLDRTTLDSTEQISHSLAAIFQESRVANLKASLGEEPSVEMLYQFQDVKEFMEEGIGRVIELLESVWPLRKTKMMPDHEKLDHSC